MTDDPAHHIDQFRAAIAGLGVEPPAKIITDGKLHRFSTNTTKHDDAGWYIYFANKIAAGAFGDFRTNKRVDAWHADIGRALTEHEHAEMRRDIDAAKEARAATIQEQQTAARKKANNMLRYSVPAPSDHPRLVSKGVGPHGLRLWKNFLVVRLIDISGETQNLQLIPPAPTIEVDPGSGKEIRRDKFFLKGGRVEGCFHVIGKLTDATTILFAEGVSTGSSLHEATGEPVVIAMNAGNYLAVATAIHGRFPDAKKIFCADDDIHIKRQDGTPYNTGIINANAAAVAIGGYIITPQFDEPRPAGLKDFNDMAALYGLSAVALRVADAKPALPRPKDEAKVAPPHKGGRLYSALNLKGDTMPNDPRPSDKPKAERDPATNWTAKKGSLDTFTPEERAHAEKQYEAWKAKPEIAARPDAYDLQGYVDMRQKQFRKKMADQRAKKAAGPSAS